MLASLHSHEHDACAIDSVRQADEQRQRKRRTKDRRAVMHDPFTPVANTSDRRSFLRLGLAAAVAAIAAGCSSSRHRTLPASLTSTTSIPRPTTSDLPDGFVDLGPVPDIHTYIASARMPLYVPAARAYVSAFPAELTNEARGAYPPQTIPLLRSGLVVLNESCPHDQCRVPFCSSSQYFECPCDGSKFSAAGEKRAGPAPRGMTIVDAAITNGRLVIDSSKAYPGVAIGVDVTKQQPAGPLCV
jgi:Rieske Fe-S protein